MTDRDELRQHCHDMIRYHQEQYHRDIQPYIDILAGMEAMEHPKPIFLTLDPETGNVDWVGEVIRKDPVGMVSVDMEELTDDYPTKPVGMLGWLGVFKR